MLFRTKELTVVPAVSATPLAVTLCVSALLAGCAAGPVTEGSRTPAPTPTQTAAAPRAMSFSAEVAGCARTTDGMETRSAGDRRERPPEIAVAGDTVRYSRALTHQCCRGVEMQHHVDGSTITIVEFWTGPGCRCLCFSTVGATLGQVPPGRYQVEVYTSGLISGGDERLPKVLVISEAVTVPAVEPVS